MSFSYDDTLFLFSLSFSFTIVIMLWRQITWVFVFMVECSWQQLIRIPIQQRHYDTSLLKQKRQSISAIPLLNANSREYLIEVGIGTPPQKFNLTLDTGR